MSLPKIMALRMGVYAILVGYLLCDLFVFKGPIHRSLNDSPFDEESYIAEQKSSGIVARVYHRPIYRAQVEEAIKEYLWRRGEVMEGKSVSERRLLREMVVHLLIDEELLKVQLKVSSLDEIAISEEQLDQEMALFKERYPNEDVFNELASRSEWAGEKEARLRLGGRIQREDYLNRQLKPTVTDEAVIAWYHAHQESLTGSFEENKTKIKDALLIQLKDDLWSQFRKTQLRPRAEGKIDIFEDVLFAEELE